MSDIFLMLLIIILCVESDKIPLLQKLKQLYKRLPVGFLIDIAYTANHTVQVVHQDGGLFLVYGIVITRNENALLANKQISFLCCFVCLTAGYSNKGYH